MFLVPALPGSVARLLPPTPLSRRLALQSLLFASADGTFRTGSAYYLYHFVGLTPAQIGLGLTLSGLASFVMAYPLGRLADRIGQKRMWVLGALLGALCWGAWPFVHGFAAYAVMVIVFEALESAANAGRNAYVLDVLPDKERVETQAFMYSSLNLGFTLGALLAGVALAIHHDVVLQWGVPFFSLAIGACNALWVSRLPHAEHDVRQDKTVPRPKAAPTGPGALRNPGWMMTSVFSSVLWTNQVLLNTVIPLWLVAETDSPRWLLAWLFGTNTVLCIVLPAYTSKGVHTVADALRRARWSAVFFVAACAVTLVTHETRGLVTILLVWLGHVLVTGAELAIGSASWAFQAELMDPTRRGEYEGVAGAGRAAGSGWAPALFTFLAMEWAPGLFAGAGWLVIAGIVVAATGVLHPSVRLADRFRLQHFPKPADPAGAGDGEPPAGAAAVAGVTT